MKQDRNLLAAHGTKLMELKPSSIVATAEADMQRKARNSKLEMGDSFEHYAFHRKHVRKAVDAHDLIVRALMEPGLGEFSGKFNTRLIYSDSALLRAAAMMTAHA